jgi:hypothetical protein
MRGPLSVRKLKRPERRARKKKCPCATEVDGLDFFAINKGCIIVNSLGS